MAIRVRMTSQAQQELGYSIERLADGLLYDFADGTFKSTPTTLIGPLVEGSGAFAGRYSATLDPTPIAQFPNGEYAVSAHLGPDGPTLDIAACPLVDGDDVPVSGSRRPVPGLVNAGFETPALPASGYA